MEARLIVDFGRKGRGWTEIGKDTGWGPTPPLGGCKGSKVEGRGRTIVSRVQEHKSSWNHGHLNTWSGI